MIWAKEKDTYPEYNISTTLIKKINENNQSTIISSVAELSEINKEANDDNENNENNDNNDTNKLITLSNDKYIDIPCCYNVLKLLSGLTIVFDDDKCNDIGNIGDMISNIDINRNTRFNELSQNIKKKMIDMSSMIWKHDANNKLNNSSTMTEPLNDHIILQHY